MRVETPEEILEQGRSEKGPAEGADTCAIKFRAELNLQDLFNDSVDIESYVKQKPPAAGGDQKAPILSTAAVAAASSGASSSSASSVPGSSKLSSG